LSDFTHKNFFDDIEDSAAGRIDGGIEARFGRGQLESEHLGVTHFRLAPGYRPPFGHRHRAQEEVYVVVAGSGRMRFEDEDRPVRQWDVIRVSPRVARGFEAGPDGMELIVVGNDRPEGGDGEMLPGFWDE
jgi:mannose-6-phosphate isomerase-like protein (cupin superfamily)